MKWPSDYFMRSLTNIFVALAASQLVVAVLFSIAFDEIHWWNLGFATTMAVIAGIIHMVARIIKVPIPYSGGSITPSQNTIAAINQLNTAMRQAISSGQPFPEKPRFQGNVIEEEGPIYGWRSFGLALKDDSQYPTLILKGSVMTWDSKEMHAHCIAVSSKEYSEFGRAKCLEHLENDSCIDGFGCGIWGRHNIAPAPVIARCRAYGTVALDEDMNWRASDVLIEKLYLHKPSLDYLGQFFNQYADWKKIADDLSINYAVPVQLVSNIEQIEMIESITLPTLGWRVEPSDA